MNFIHTKHVRGALSLQRKKGTSRLKKVCLCCILFSLIHLTLCDKVNVMLDEFTGHVRALVTCATLWSQIIRLMLMLHVGDPQFYLIGKISKVAAEVEVLWPPQCLIHLHTMKLDWLWLLPFLCVRIILYLCRPLGFCCSLRLVPVCPLPIYFLLPLTFHSPHTCLLSEDRPLCGSPPHVQCDQYKGQGPCTQTPPLTKREGLKAGETAWWVQVRVRACLWVCLHAHVLVCLQHMCVCLCVRQRTSRTKTCELRIRRSLLDGPGKPRVHDPSLCHSKRSLQVTKTHTHIHTLTAI